MARYVVQEGNDSEYRIVDTEASRPEWAPYSPVYVVHDSGQPWHHWIKEIADAHCRNLNEGKI